MVTHHPQCALDRGHGGECVHEHFGKQFGWPKREKDYRTIDGLGLYDDDPLPADDELLRMAREHLELSPDYSLPDRVRFVDFAGRIAARMAAMKPRYRYTLNWSPDDAEVAFTAGDCNCPHFKPAFIGEDGHTHGFTYVCAYDAKIWRATAAAALAALGFIEPKKTDEQRREEEKAGQRG